MRRIADGDAVFSPRLAGFVLDAFASIAPVEVDPELEQLTAREREVLRHIARGYLYKEIAARLGISTKTVEAHVSAVLRKLQLSHAARALALGRAAALGGLGSPHKSHLTRFTWPEMIASTFCRSLVESDSGDRLNLAVLHR